MKKMLLVFALFSLIALPSLSHAEPYVSVYVGGAFPHDADTVSNDGTNIKGTAEFDSSIAVGLKGGYWFTEANAPWFGVQLDINRHSADFINKVNSSDLSAFLGVPATGFTEAGATVTSYTANILFRAPEGNIKPYVGVGAGWFEGEVDDGTGAIYIPSFGLIIAGPFQGAKDTAFGWQVLAGVDFFVNNNISTFAEYKYSRADFKFGGGVDEDVEYGVSQVYGGVSYHF